MSDFIKYIWNVFLTFVLFWVLTIILIINGTIELTSKTFRWLYEKTLKKVF